MLFVRDKGRMCNNILQYAHVYAWGREHGRSTMSMRFAYKYRYFRLCRQFKHNFLYYVAAKYAAKWGLLPVVSFHKENEDTSEQEQTMLSRRNIVVEGWYARWYDLFLKYKPEILDLFAFKDDIERRVQTVMQDSEGMTRLGVHIRRGDYATFHGGDFFYSDKQYADVISSFLELHKDEHVAIYICGNDPRLDQDYYRQRFSGCSVIFPNGSAAEDLCLLSHCHFLMGPPSTFSLVAAMYHDAPLCWIDNPAAPVTADSFKPFDYLFRHIV